MGIYAGINGGYSFGRFTSGGGSYFGNTSGGLVGGTIGYNYQSGQLVAGLEGDLDWSNLGGNGSPRFGVASSGTVTGTTSVRARFGYAMDRALLFVTGGYAGGWIRGKANDAVSFPNLYLSQSNYLNGYALGAGMEYAITNSISVKAEYLFNSLPSQTFFGGTVDKTGVGVNFSTLRAGVNYHF
jgi:outer membrane immunogenic protein